MSVRVFLGLCVALATPSADADCGCDSNRPMDPNSFVSYIPIQGRLVSVIVNDEKGKAVFGGDVVLGTTVELRRRAREVERAGGIEAFNRGGGIDLQAVGSGQAPWKDGIVPYEVSLPAGAQRRDFEASVKHWNELLAGTIQLRPRNGEARYVRVTQVSGNTCSWSPSSSGGALKLATGYPGCARHELGHVLGLWHEQMRHDRSSHVDVFWPNIQKGSCSQFQRLDERLSYGAYDLGSVMHYRTRTASCNGKKTLESKPPGKIARENDKITPGDVEGVKRAQAPQ